MSKTQNSSAPSQLTDANTSRSILFRYVRDAHSYCDDVLIPLQTPAANHPPVGTPRRSTRRQRLILVQIPCGGGYNCPLLTGSTFTTVYENSKWPLSLLALTTDTPCRRGHNLPRHGLRLLRQKAWSDLDLLAAGQVVQTSQPFIFCVIAKARDRSFVLFHV